MSFLDIIVGDIVAVFASGRSAISDKLLSGVVTKSTEVAVIVAFEEVPEAVNLSSLSGQLQLVKLANDVTYRRLKRYYLHVLINAKKEGEKKKK